MMSKESPMKLFGLTEKRIGWKGQNETIEL